MHIYIPDLYVFLPGTDAFRRNSVNFQRFRVTFAGVSTFSRVHILVV